jgi:hypothetical protein
VRKLASEYSLGMSVLLGEGAMVKLLIKLAIIANFTSINANLIPGNQMQIQIRIRMRYRAIII